jgi:hypothetical protein
VIQPGIRPQIHGAAAERRLEMAQLCLATDRCAVRTDVVDVLTPVLGADDPRGPN